MENMKFDSLRRAYIRRIILAVALLLAVILTVPTFMDLPSRVLSENYKETAYAAEVYNSDDGRNVFDPDLGKALSKIKFCFVAGTAVVMAGRYTKTIENIHIGDIVKSYNPTTGQIQDKRVLQTFENTTNELVKVTTSDGQEIIATPGHKFFANNKWVSAENLRAGDILVNVNGQKIVVEAVQHELLENPVKIYNFEVSDNHTYFVGSENGVAVHNADCAKSGTYKFKVDLGDGSEAVYIGKGTSKRMAQSMKEKALYGEVVGKGKFFKCADDTAAFIKEAELMRQAADNGQKLLNKIASPGFKLGNISKDGLVKVLLGRKGGWHL